MKEFIYDSFYGKPLDEVVLLMIVFIGTWIMIFGEIQYNWKLKKIWKVTNVLVLLGDIIVIILVTLSARGGVSEIILKPFQSFEEAKIQPEIYRSMMMNIFLFFPFGLTFPYVLPERWKSSAMIAIWGAFAISVSIEFLQYYFQLGQAETDDVICNTLGSAFGTVAYLTRKNYDKKVCFGESIIFKNV